MRQQMLHLWLLVKAYNVSMAWGCNQSSWWTWELDSSPHKPNWCHALPNWLWDELASFFLIRPKPFALALLELSMNGWMDQWDIAFLYLLQPLQEQTYSWICMPMLLRPHSATDSLGKCRQEWQIVMLAMQSQLSGFIMRSCWSHSMQYNVSV